MGTEMSTEEQPRLGRREMLSATALAFAGCSGARWEPSGTARSPIEPGPTVGLEPVAEGIEMPTAFESPSDASIRGYVAEKGGRVFTLDHHGKRERPFLDVRERLVELTNWEQGLLGLELHPEFANNGRFYVRYSAPPGGEIPREYSHRFRLSEFKANRDRRTADPASERVLLEIPQPYATHQAGAIEFGPDGYLYVAVGDGGGGNGDSGRGHVSDWYASNRGGNGQDVEANLLGSVLRIDVNREGADRPYAIPDDNPLVGEPGLNEHYAWGFRNPFSMSFHGSDLYVADVGKLRYEEVNIVKRGGNYGWNVREGPACFDNIDTRAILSDPFLVFDWGYLQNLVVSLLGQCPTTTPDKHQLTDPVIAYPQKAGGEVVGSAVIGGHVYENDTIPSLTGKYVFGDLMAKKSGRLFAASSRRQRAASEADGKAANDGTTDDGSTGGDGLWSMQELTVANTESGRLGGLVLSIGEDQDGELYVLSNGTIYKLVPA